MTRPPIVIHLKNRRTVAPSAVTTHPAESASYTPPRGKTNPMAEATVCLRDRLVERPGRGYFLDGQPASLDQIMQATNRVLAAKGLDQVLHSERWRAR